jgi:preprotein translocase subunit SecB
MEKKLESGFKIKSIILLESNFSRISQVVFDNKIENKVDINVQVAVNGLSINVVEIVSVKQEYEGTLQVNFMVKMVGMFEKIGESNIQDLNTFGKVNGAAIIFPYIREHISNLSLKAGLGSIILPPANFTEKENKEVK